MLNVFVCVHRHVLVHESSCCLSICVKVRGQLEVVVPSTYGPEEQTQVISGVADAFTH